jgi:phage terminase large subunit-like protein
VNITVSTVTKGVKPPDFAIRCKSDEQFIAENGTWEQDHGDRVCHFIESNLTLESGQKFLLLPWQRRYLESVYCWRRKDGRRRVKVALLTLARKNGKTAILAGQTAWHLWGAGHQSGSVVSCAVDREQAGQIFDSLHWSIKQNPRLAKVSHVVPSRKEVNYPAKNGRYKSLSCDAGGAYGHGHVFVCHDELAFHKSDALFTALKNSTDSRPDGLQVIISTAGFNKNGAFFRLYQYAKAVLSGEVIDTTFMPWVFEIDQPEQHDLDSPDTWRLSNPSLGTTLDIDDFKAQWSRAKFDTAGKLDFYRLKFNSWTEGRECWLPVEKWEASKGEFPDLKGAPVHIGLDGGGLQDISACTAVFPVNGKYYVRSWGLVPRKACEERITKNLVPYQRFTLDGSLKIIPGDVIGIETDLYPLLDRLIADHDVKTLTVDRWQLDQLAQHYMALGVNVLRFAQNHARYNDPCRTLERVLLNDQLRTDGNSLLRWQVGHVMLSRNPQGQVKPEKPSEGASIDCVVALVMAMSQATLEPIAKPQPVISFW